MEQIKSASARLKALIKKTLGRDKKPINTQMKKVNISSIVVFHTTEEQRNLEASRNGKPSNDLAAIVVGVETVNATPAQEAIAASEGVEAKDAVAEVPASTTVTLQVLNNGAVSGNFVVENVTEGSAEGQWSWPTEIE